MGYLDRLNRLIDLTSTLEYNTYLCNELRELKKEIETQTILK